MSIIELLQASRRNVFSQYGEDGLIEALLGFLETKSGWCVEFGAWDGIHLSNTCNLLRNHEYRGVLIEADKQKFLDLQKNCQGTGAIAINAEVGWTGDCALDHILQSTPIPRDFDLLSIDVDGNDYHIWKSINAYDPKVVLIEYNPTMGDDINFVQPADREVNQGSSFRSIVELARTKGYQLVGCTDVNAIFLRADLSDRIGISGTMVENLTPPWKSARIYCGYDGTVFFQGEDKMPWQPFSFSDLIVQIPGGLRHYPPVSGRIAMLRRSVWLFLKKLIG